MLHFYVRSARTSLRALVTFPSTHPILPQQFFPNQIFSGFSVFLLCWPNIFLFKTFSYFSIFLLIFLLLIFSSLSFLSTKNILPPQIFSSPSISADQIHIYLLFPLRSFSSSKTKIENLWTSASESKINSRICQSHFILDL